MKTLMFPDKLIFSEHGYINGSLIIQLEQSIRCRCSWGTITVPGGFYSDGASIPRLFWNIFSPFGPYLDGAIVHDFLYSHMSDLRYSSIDQKKADDIFLECMTASGIGWLKRQAIHKALRLFGWTAYKKRWNAFSEKHDLL